MNNVDFDSKERPYWLQPPGKCLSCERPLFRTFVCDACFKYYKNDTSRIISIKK